MTISVSPTEDDVFKTLKAFIGEILPAGIEIVRAQGNRVAPPKAQNYVYLTPTMRRRLKTTVTIYADVRFIGTISGTTMTVTEVTLGKIKTDAKLFGVDVVDGTTVGAQISGTPGGPGTYAVSTSQSLSERVLACGVFDALQETELTVQVDVYGPASGDNVQRFTTLFRDDYGVRYFRRAAVAAAPLYADEAAQVPLVAGEEQFIDRWSVKACLAVNDVVSDVPLQFADSIVVNLVNVDSQLPA